MATTLARALCAAALSVGVLAGTAVPAHAETTSADGGRATGLQRTSVAAGSFAADVDLATAALRDAPGGGCVLTVDGTLTFSGTVAGVADGTTTAVIAAPCAQVAVTPPGTYADVFRFVGDFTGTVAGSPATARLAYAGVTREGGAIDAGILLHGGAWALLQVDAVVTQGGTYAGLVARP